MAYKVTLEPLIFLSFLDMALRSSLSTNLIIYRSCHLILGYNKSECAQLGNTANNVTEDLEKKVEPTANVIQMTLGLTVAISSVLICLFVGSWSSRFGRKPACITSISGLLISSSMDTIFCFFENISPWYFLLSHLPLMICGGFYSYIVVIYSYIADVTTNEDRSFRMAIYEVVGMIGTVSGTFISTYLFYATNYTTVFALGASCYILSLIYVIFVVEESIQKIETEGRLKSFFDISNIKEMIKTTTKKRRHHDRLKIILIAFITATYLFAETGQKSVCFLFLRQKLKWTLTKFNTYRGVQQIINALGVLVGTYIFQKLLHLREVVTVIIVMTSRAIGAIVTGLASQDWHIYLGSFIICFDGIVGPLSTSIVSKLVPHEDIGSIFSAMMAIKFLLLLGAGTTYGTIYNKTIDINSGIYNFVSAGVYGIDILLMLSVIVIEFIPSSKIIIQRRKNEESKEDGSIPIKQL